MVNVHVLACPFSWIVKAEVATLGQLEKNWSPFEVDGTLFSSTSGLTPQQRQQRGPAVVLLRRFKKEETSFILRVVGHHHCRSAATLPPRCVACCVAWCGGS